MFRRTALSLFVLALAAPALAADQAPKTLRVYFVGNSVTDVIKYGPLAELAKSRGYKQVWGRHMIPGAPLQWIWEHPKDGFQEPPFGHYPTALANFQWDVLSLQPFDRHLDGKDGDIAMAKNFIDLALPKSPDLQIYVYARWPRLYVQGKPFMGFSTAPPTPALGKPTLFSGFDDWDTAWNKKYTGGWDNTNETKDYFERLTLELRKAYPKLKKPILMVPVGHVMYELNQEMKAGKVPGYTDITQLFADGIHLNNVGSYVVGCTYFATLYKQNPKGLPSAPYKVEDAKLTRIIHDAVWSVVSTNELAGVKGAAGVATLKSDPIAAIRSVLPKGWTILKVEGNTYPPRGGKGSGKAIFLFSPEQHLIRKQSKASVVYIMPADYQYGEDPAHGEAATYRAALILTTSAAKVYLRGNETPFSATGWKTLKDDILKAIVE